MLSSLVIFLFALAFALANFSAVVMELLEGASVAGGEGDSARLEVMASSSYNRSSLKREAQGAMTI